MDLSQWFTDQLNAGAEGFIWAIEQVPPERNYSRRQNVWANGTQPVTSSTCSTMNKTLLCRA